MENIKRNLDYIDFCVLTINLGSARDLGVAFEIARRNAALHANIVDIVAYDKNGVPTMKFGCLPYGTIYEKEL